MKRCIALCSALMLVLAGCGDKKKDKVSQLDGQWTLATADGINLESNVTFSGKKFTYVNPVQVSYEGEFKDSDKNVDIEIPTVNAETYHGAMDSDDENMKALMIELENALIGDMSGGHKYKIIDKKKRYLYIEGYSERDAECLYVHIAEALAHAFQGAWRDSGLTAESEGKPLVISSDTSMNINVKPKSASDKFYEAFADGYQKWAKGYFNNTDNFSYDLEDMCYIICADENYLPQFAAYSTGRDDEIVSFVGSLYDKEAGTYYDGEYYFKKYDIKTLGELYSHLAAEI